MKIQAAIVTSLAAVALLAGGGSADAVGGVRFTKIYYDPPGADVVPTAASALKGSP